MQRRKAGEQGASLLTIIAVLGLIGSFVLSPAGSTESYGMGAIGGVMDFLGMGVVTSVSEEYYGNINIIINQQDNLAGGAVTPTTPIYSLYHEAPARFGAGIALTPAGTTLEVNPSDNGYIYLDMYTGDDFYMVEDTFRRANARVVETYWNDFDTDGRDDFIAKIYVGDVGTPGQAQTPTVTLVVPLLDEDVAGLADGDPADQTGIGETETVVSITWTLSGFTAGDGAYLTRLYFTTNSTRGGDHVQFEEMTLSGGWTQTSGAQTYFPNPIHEENGNYEAWYIDADDYLEPHQGMRLWRSTNEPDTMYLTLNIRCTFSTNNKVDITMYAVFMTPDGVASATVSDEVRLEEA